MTYLNCFSIALVLTFLVIGTQKGWLTQAYYLMIGIVIYIFAKRIDNGVFLIVFLPNLNIQTQKIVHFQAACIVVFLIFYVFKRLHRNFFKIVDEVPGHKVIGGLVGFVNGFLILLFIYFTINLTNFKDDPVWTDSLEYQFSKTILDLMN